MKESKFLKINLKEERGDIIRKELLYTDQAQVAAIGNEDVDNLFDSANGATLLVARGENLKQALDELKSKKPDVDQATKAVIVVRCSPSYQLQVSEISELTDYIKELPHAIDIRWGLSHYVDKEADVNVVVATSN